LIGSPPVLQTDVARAVIGLSASSAIIAFGILTVVPTLLEIVGLRDPRVDLLDQMEYRFFKRLVTGRSLWLLFFSAIGFLIASGLALLALVVDSSLLATASAALALAALFVLVAVLLWLLYRSSRLTDSEIETLREYTPEDD